MNSITMDKKKTVPNVIVKIKTLQDKIPKSFQREKLEKLITPK